MTHDELFGTIDLARSRIRPYSGFIFLCGGPVDVSTQSPQSVREALCRELARDTKLNDRVRLAEDYKDWSSDSIYRDLLLFERHLAELSSVIVLILESPGSIAELGIFTALKEFQSKILLFIETRHYGSDSFIKLGPVNFLEKERDNPAECYTWYVGKPGASKLDAEALNSLCPEFVETIRGRASKPIPSHPFSSESWLDSALVICDLLNICSALTIGEIAIAMNGFGVKRGLNDIRQILFILERLGVLSMEPNSTQRFYVNLKSSLFCQLHITGDISDIDRIRIDLLADYEAHDKKRFRAIRNVRKRHA